MVTRHLYYRLLPDHSVEPIPGPSEWGWDSTALDALDAAWAPENRRVAREVLGDEVEVSTVFLVINHQFLDGPPMLFETMIFGGPFDQYQWRYPTWDEAQAGHRRVVEALRAGNDPDVGSIT